MTQPDLPPSEEVFRQELFEILIVETDWDAHFANHAAQFRKLEEKLDIARDPQEVLLLTAQKAETSISCLGSMGIAGWRRSILDERAAFEAAFDE